MNDADMATLHAMAKLAAPICGTCPGNRAAVVYVDDLTETELDDGTVRIVFRCHGRFDYVAFVKKTARLRDVVMALPGAVFPREPN